MAEPLPWKNRLNAELFRVAWPIAVSMISHGTMSLVDTLFVAQLGTQALAAVGLGGVAAFFLVCFPFGLLRSVKVAVSQAVGAGRRASVVPFVGAGLWLAITLGLVFGVAGWALAPTATRFALHGEAAHLASDYLSTRSLGAPAFLIWIALSEARYGLGKSRLVMVVVLAGNALNIVLTALFVLALGWGVTGAAVATVLGNLLTTALLLAAQVRPGLGLRQVRWPHLRRLWSLGFPLGLQFIVESSAFMLLVGIVARFGEIQLAAHEVALQLCHFIFLPTMAIGEAGSVLVGQAVGAGQDDQVRRISRRTWLVAFGYASACGAALALAPHSFSRLFTSDAELTRLLVSLLICSAVFQAFHATNIIARATLRGTGDVTFAAVVSIGLAWVVTPPLAWCLGGVCGLGALGGWIGLTLEVGVGALVLWWRLERGGWQHAANRSRSELNEDAPSSPTPITSPA